MFLQASVILSTGGVSASVHVGIPPPWSRHPPPLGADTPEAYTPSPPREQTPPRADTPRKQTPAYGQRAAGTHPTGMHSCL